MRVSCLQNNPVVGPGGVARWAESRGHAITTHPLFQASPMPSLETCDLLVALGGDPTQCTDWLNEEIATIRSAIEHGKGVLGLCLGGQLIAEALGGKLVPHTHAEAGWWPVRLNAAGRAHPLLAGVDPELDLFFFHKNTFLLPEKGVLLAENDGCKHQIFAYRDRVLGFQAHPEFTQATILDLTEHHKAAMLPGPFVRLSPADASETDKITTAWKFLDRALDNIVRALAG